MTGDRQAFYTKSDTDRELVEGDDHEPYRSAWRHDYARLIHSPSFRRLQGKTQLFPGENDFFRNRLTHSLEVAQIAKSIALRLNHETEEIDPTCGEEFCIAPDLVEFAALAHDLGHPPFGHNGEAALDECMCAHGGFEGNAQTLRILTSVEKKRTSAFPNPDEFEDGCDLRLGLNLTHRSLAAVLKYDNPISIRQSRAKLIKGYYESESDIVQRIKKSVLGSHRCVDSFKTVECQIMDIADDIAYSTYDLEDALKAGFTSPLDFIEIQEKDDLLTKIAITVWKRMNDRDDEVNPGAINQELINQIENEKSNVVDILFDITIDLIPPWAEIGLEEAESVPEKQAGLFLAVARAYQASKKLRTNGYLRTQLTSQLVGEFINSVTMEYDPKCPSISKILIEDSARRKIEVLKNFTYEVHILAARLKTVEFRGKDIVSEIFNCLKEDTKNQLLPEDWRDRCEALKSDENKRLRVFLEIHG